MDVANLSAHSLLGLKAGALFPDEAKAHSLFKLLAKKWHPDVAGESGAKVWLHISAQYEIAKDAYKRGDKPNALTIDAGKKGRIIYPYIATRMTEIGKMYICSRHIVWEVSRDLGDLVKQAADVGRGFKFPTKELEEKWRPLLPNIQLAVRNNTAAYLVVGKSPTSMRLRDILDATGPLPPTAVAWVLNRAYGLAGYMSYAGIRHFDISVDSLFVDVASHTGYMYGGWFYSSRAPKKPIAAPARMLRYVKPVDTFATGNMIRAMGRELLGCKTFAELRARKDVPAPLKAWLLSASTSDIHAETHAWRKEKGGVLEQSFGPPKFVPLIIPFQDVYK